MVRERLARILVAAAMLLAVLACIVHPDDVDGYAVDQRCPNCRSQFGGA